MRPNLGLLALAVTLAVSVLCVTETPNVAAQKGNIVRSRDPSERPTQRPPVGGRNAGAFAGHPLTAAAAFEVLVEGCNALDAGVAAMAVLEKWGTMSFEQVSARAIEYARDGFPLRPRTAASIEGNLDFFKKWPGNQRYWLKPDGSMYKPGETIKLPTLAHTLTLMV